ncbi:hypothetical protein ACQP2E_19225 [Actinoplanes sp. CA-015351]|uniref:hypothetical protein n=1 Tax=Actinoplanes sp. CA-015351 TaxID=3239897 RepID=UPI003D9A07DD
MSTDVLTDIPFYWEFVPSASEGADERSRWTDHMIEFFGKWAGRTLGTAQAAWTAGEFPFTAENVGRETATMLMARADELPGHARLAWGTAFHDGQVRWSPIPLVAEFHRPRADDPEYLMEIVGVHGFAEDAREAVVHYVSVPGADGVRVFAIGRTPQGTAYGRLDAAMRTESGIDVVLRTRVFDMQQMAVIGAGVEQLMATIAADGIAEQP